MPALVLDDGSEYAIPSHVAWNLSDRGFIYHCPECGENVFHNRGEQFTPDHIRNLIPESVYPENDPVFVPTNQTDL